VTREPYLCASHFAQSDFSYSFFRTILRPDAIPFFEDSKIGEMKRIERTGNEDKKEIDSLKEPRAVFLPLPIFNAVKKMCYLCGATMNFYYATPDEPLQRASFLARVITTRQADVHSISMLRRNKLTGRFCIKHLHTEIPPNKQAIPSK
ncbi:hypothetical protein PMAYCL1PPCAC_01549, partial [Pristionchus mayeri]